MAAGQDANSLLTDGESISPDALLTGNFLESFLGDVPAHADCGELPSDPARADAFSSARPGKGSGETLVVEPVLVGQPANRGVDRLLVEVPDAKLEAELSS